MRAPTFLLWLPLLASAQTYVDPSTGLTWKLINYPYVATQPTC
jgi:hypothetical protein